MPSEARAPLRAAVAGYGAYGRIHARKYFSHPDAQLVAIADRDARRRHEVRADFPGIITFPDTAGLIGHADIASVTVPASSHHAVARRLLAAGMHLLVEKPFTTSSRDACDLADLARASHSLLQAGYLERFNSTLAELRARLPAPQYIEARRLTQWRGRGGDVNVVLDLMIHDIDILLEIVAAPIVRIEARGMHVLSSEWDVANAQLHFGNGCVGNLTASRASPVSERRLHVFAEHACGLADIDGGTLLLHQRGDGSAVETERRLHRREDPLAMEIDAFIQAVRQQREPPITAADARRALRVAERIIDVMEQDAGIAARTALPITGSQHAIAHLLRRSPHA